MAISAEHGTAPDRGRTVSQDSLLYKSRQASLRGSLFRVSPLLGADTIPTRPDAAQSNRVVSTTPASEEIQGLHPVGALWIQPLSLGPGMTGYEKYQSLMANWAAEYMQPFIGVDGDREEMPEPSRVFLAKLFCGFTEVSGAEEALRLSEVLISLAPPRSRKIRKDEYLKYHINAYIQEVYILKERLNPMQQP